MKWCWLSSLFSISLFLPLCSPSVRPSGTNAPYRARPLFSSYLSLSLIPSRRQCWRKLRRSGASPSPTFSRPPSQWPRPRPPPNFPRTETESSLRWAATHRERVRPVPVFCSHVSSEHRIGTTDKTTTTTTSVIDQILPSFLSALSLINCKSPPRSPKHNHQNHNHHHHQWGEA